MYPDRSGTVTTPSAAPIGQSLDMGLAQSGVEPLVLALQLRLMRRGSRPACHPGATRPKSRNCRSQIPALYSDTLVRRAASTTATSPATIDSTIL
ncbi:hypothetical protein, partial [Catenulispora rubra]|uniref:hypothetical protein n=1 Tax=Catenulispora rubra TaxID=280293 RepID=UPI001E378388